MAFSQEAALLAKAVWSAALVLGLAAIAERVSTRIAGILAGAPQNALLVYFFVGRDMGTAYVVKSVPHGIVAFTATLAFVLAYYWASLRLRRFTPALSAFIGLVVFVAVAAVLAAIPFTMASAAALTLCAVLLAVWLFRKIEFVTVTRPVRYTARLMLLRGGVAAVLVVCITALAEHLGARWAGLLTGFPTVLLPTLLIVHLTYGMASTHALIRNFPIGMGSIILYILSIPLTFPHFGVYGGTVVSLGVAFVYLAAVVLWGRRWAARRSVPPAGP